MKFTRSTYPPFLTAGGSPCWTLTASHLWADADWNTRFPFGVCLAASAGPGVPRRSGWAGFSVDVNAPLGEPNRLAVHAGPVRVTLGLPSFRDYEPAGTGPGGLPVIRVVARLRSLHLEGLSRYRYHRDPAAPRGWARNARPEPLHWGWLTIERTRRR